MGIEIIKDWEGVSIFTLLSSNAITNKGFPVVDSSEHQRYWCNEVQKRQDAGERWKYCVANADAMFAL